MPVKNSIKERAKKVQTEIKKEVQKYLTEPPAPNKYKVPTRLWKSFKTEQKKNLFNSVMDQSLKDQNHIIHPETGKIPKEQWKTICWNISCLAAWSI